MTEIIVQDSTLDAQADAWTMDLSQHGFTRVFTDDSLVGNERTHQIGKARWSANGPSTCPTEEGDMLAQLSPSSTNISERSAKLDETLVDLFLRSTDEHFEDGMETAFSRGLQGVIVENGNVAIEALVNLICRNQTTASAAGEALRWIGRFDESSTTNYRRWLLEKCLFDERPLVRDGAILGLAAMDDDLSVESVQKAIEREPLPELRQDLEQLLTDLLSD